MISKCLKAVCLAAIGSLVVAAGASATTATTKIVLQPHGHLYKEIAKPVSATFEANIIPAPGALTLNPLMEAKMFVPKGTKFVPNKKMPVCKYFNKVTANVETSVALKKSGCADALVGNGVATLYLVQSTNPAALDTTPRLLIFNGGTDKHGNGKIVIQAYSYKTKVGITFNGKIVNGVLDVHIPRLTYDSSVPAFDLQIPGKTIPSETTATYTTAKVPAGKDPNFVRAQCSTGKWTSSADYYLGKRSETGAVSDRSTVKSASYEEFCKGLKGRPVFRHMKIRGPRQVKRGHKAVYRVTIKNGGTRTARHVRVKATGAGHGYRKDGNIAPGSHKTIKVKVRVTGKKGHKALIRFKAVKTGAKVWGKYRVKVK